MWMHSCKRGQLSPRLGVVYKIFEYKIFEQTTLHAGYARYFTPPPTELVASKDLALFQNTVNSPGALGNSTANGLVKSERDNYYDAGISQALTPEWPTGLDAYYKQARHLLDEGQFGAALVFTPFNYEQGKVYGVELTNSFRKGAFGAYLNVAWSMARGQNIESAQFNFSQTNLTDIATHYIFLDHDQRLTGSGGMSYLWQRTTFTTDFLFGSGLRSTDLGGVPNGAHLPAYTTGNLGVARPFKVTGIGRLTGRLAVLNVFDKTYEIRDGTGVGVGAPQFGLRRAFYAGLNKVF